MKKWSGIPLVLKSELGKYTRDVGVCDERQRPSSREKDEGPTDGVCEWSHMSHGVRGDDMTDTKDEMDNAMDNATDGHVAVKEGMATIFQPKTVFYNKVQEFNRDLR